MRKRNVLIRLLRFPVVALIVLYDLLVHGRVIHLKEPGEKDAKP